MRIEYLVEHNPRQLKRCIQRLFKQWLITQAVRQMDVNHYMMDEEDTSVKKTHSTLVRFKTTESDLQALEKALKQMFPKLVVNLTPHTPQV